MEAAAAVTAKNQTCNYPKLSTFTQRKGWRLNDRNTVMQYKAVQLCETVNCWLVPNWGIMKVLLICMTRTFLCINVVTIVDNAINKVCWGEWFLLYWVLMTNVKGDVYTCTQRFIVLLQQWKQKQDVCCSITVIYSTNIFPDPCHPFKYIK